MLFFGEGLFSKKYRPEDGIEECGQKISDPDFCEFQQVGPDADDEYAPGSSNCIKECGILHKEKF
jgi:hypothetical protein